MTQASPSADDIAYIRHLSESGSRAPLLGGRFMAWWGLLLVVAYLAQHFAATGRLGSGPGIFGIIWGSFGLLGVAGQLLLARSIGDKPGQGSAGNLAMRAVWTAGAFSIGAMVVGTALISDANVAGIRPWDFIVPVAFAVYACALGVTGSLAGNRTLKLAAALAVIMVGLFTALVAQPERYLLVAAGAAATVLLPGLLLMRTEPKG
ncbi:MAG TPA: hypothetical protein VEC11_14320 [Allosphingosinicella sp.]|nr:hypothetical protein [Allosphingosinicella sp.]